MYAIQRNIKTARWSGTYYAATDIDWKAWVDGRTLLFTRRQDAERFRKQYIWEADAVIAYIPF